MFPNQYSLYTNTILADGNSVYVFGGKSATRARVTRNDHGYRHLDFARQGAVDVKEREVGIFLGSWAEVVTLLLQCRVLVWR